MNRDECVRAWESGSTCTGSTCTGSGCYRPRNIALVDCIVVLEGGRQPVGTMFTVVEGVRLAPNVIRCAGQELSRVTYADLYRVIGTTYGVGDGVTTFCIPDRRGNFGVDAEQLLPCPFCGSDNVRIWSTPQDLHGGVCDGCGAHAPWSLTKANAIAIWNRRAFGVIPGLLKQQGAAPAGDARNAALEEAARICDEEYRIRDKAGRSHPEDSASRDRCWAGSRAAWNCAQEIRAAKSREGESNG